MPMTRVQGGPAQALTSGLESGLLQGLPLVPLQGTVSAMEGWRARTLRSCNPADITSQPRLGAGPEPWPLSDRQAQNRGPFERTSCAYLYTAGAWQPCGTISPNPTASPRGAHPAPLGSPHRLMLTSASGTAPLGVTSSSPQR